jgi:hypothetical protein
MSYTWSFIGDLLLYAICYAIVLGLGWCVSHFLGLPSWSVGVVLLVLALGICVRRDLK